MSAFINPAASRRLAEYYEAKAAEAASNAKLDFDRLPRATRRRATLTAAGVAAVSALVLGAALDAPARVGHQYDRFVNPGQVGSAADLRSHEQERTRRAERHDPEH